MVLLVVGCVGEDETEGGLSVMVVMVLAVSLVVVMLAVVIVMLAVCGDDVGGGRDNLYLI